MNEPVGQTDAASDARRHYYEAKASVYRNMSSEAGARELAVLRLFPPRPALRVLDVGCGSGRFLRVLGNAGHDAVGTDISQASVEAACASGVRAVRGDVESGTGLEGFGREFDVITMLDVLEHTFEPAAAVETLAAYVRPGGCLIASVPNIGSLVGRAHVLAGRFPLNPHGLFDAGHIRWFTASNLARHFEGARSWTLAEWTGAPMPGLSAFGLWRTDRLQAKFFELAARMWPSLFGYQLIFKLALRPAERPHAGSEPGPHAR